MARWVVFLAGFLLGAGVAALLALLARRRALGAESARLSRLAHDLRTPLSSITAYGEILADGEENDPVERSRFLGIINEEARRLGAMIERHLGSKRPAVVAAPEGASGRDRPGEPAPSVPHPRPTGSTRTILVVDDDRFIVEATRTLLSREGYAALGASGGEEALARARSARPDLILMDLVMPDLGGGETLRRLRSDPATRGIPVIITTGDADEAVPEGADAVLSKPVTREDLLATIGRVCHDAVAQAERGSEA